MPTWNAWDEPPPWATREINELNVISIGSRSFGKSIASVRRTDADYDYSVQYDPNIVKRFQNLGYTYKEDYDTADGDDLFKGVLTKKAAGEEVDLVLHTNELLFRKTWASMTPEFYRTFIWKSSPTFAFKTLDKQGARQAISAIMNQLYKTAQVYLD